MKEPTFNVDQDISLKFVFNELKKKFPNNAVYVVVNYDPIDSTPIFRAVIDNYEMIHHAKNETPSESADRIEMLYKSYAKIGIDTN